VEDESVRLWQSALVGGQDTPAGRDQRAAGRPLSRRDRAAEEARPEEDEHWHIAHYKSYSNN
jgi:hypothetical protein